MMSKQKRAVQCSAVQCVRQHMPACMYQIFVAILVVQMREKETNGIRTGRSPPRYYITTQMQVKTQTLRGHCAVMRPGEFRKSCLTYTAPSRKPATRHTGSNRDRSSGGRISLIKTKCSRSVSR